MTLIAVSTRAFGLGNVDMPSVSKKQHNLMAAVAHNPSFAKRVGISQSVGKHFSDADKGKKFGKGGSMKANELKGKAKETKSIADEEMKALKRGHAPKKILEHERAEHEEMGYKHGGKTHHMAKGGMRHKKPSAMGGMGGMDPAALAAMAGPPGGGAGPMAAGPGAMPGMAHGGSVHHHHAKVSHHHHHHYARGGKIEMPFKKPMVEKIIGDKKRANPDGAEKKGHTKGKVVKMAHGGHVGGHHSRGGGIESKGKTKYKVC